jgi:hypothetical protein
MVGRKQRRFIVKVALPPGLQDEASVARWLVPSLAEVAGLCRQYLPTKPREYPAEALAQEVEALAEHLLPLAMITATVLGLAPEAAAGPRQGHGADLFLNRLPTPVRPEVGRLATSTA